MDELLGAMGMNGFDGYLGALHRNRRQAALVAMTTHLATAMVREEDRLLSGLVPPEQRHKAAKLIAERSLHLACQIIEVVDEKLQEESTQGDEA